MKQDLLRKLQPEAQEMNCLNSYALQRVDGMWTCQLQGSRRSNLSRTNVQETGSWNKWNATNPPTTDYNGGGRGKTPRNPATRRTMKCHTIGALTVSRIQGDQVQRCHVILIYNLARHGNTITFRKEMKGMKHWRETWTVDTIERSDSSCSCISLMLLSTARRKGMLHILQEHDSYTAIKHTQKRSTWCRKNLLGARCCKWWRHRPCKILQRTAWIQICECVNSIAVLLLQQALQQVQIQNLPPASLSSGLTMRRLFTHSRIDAKTKKQNIYAHGLPRNKQGREAAAESHVNVVTVVLAQIEAKSYSFQHPKMWKTFCHKTYPGQERFAK